jgi:hypothetical protein
MQGRICWRSFQMLYDAFNSVTFLPCEEAGGYEHILSVTRNRLASCGYACLLLAYDMHHHAR